MYTFLLVLLIIDSVVLVTAILLQSGKGDGLSASFGGVSSSSDSLLGTRQAGNLLTKTSWWGGGLFLFLAFVLSPMSTQQRAPTASARAQRSVTYARFSWRLVESGSSMFFQAPTSEITTPASRYDRPGLAEGSWFMGK